MVEEVLCVIKSDVVTVDAFFKYVAGMSTWYDE
jgi:hypothetical protein